MANTQISQLPSYTGTAADLRWFVMNNSGETISYKFSGYTSQIIPATGVESYISLNLPRTYAPSDYMYIFGKTNAASTGQYSSVWGGRNNKTDNQFGAVVGGYSNTAGYICGVFAGGVNNAQGNGSVILGGESNTVNGSYLGMLGCYNSSASMGNDTANAMIAGHSNIFSANGVQGNAMIGGRSNSWYHFDSRDPVIGAPRYGLGSIIGGYQNRIEGNTTNSNGAHAYPILLGGTLNKIFGQESDNSATTGATIINSYSSSIYKSSWSSVIGGIDNDITSTDKSSIIGGAENYMSGASESGIFGGKLNTNNGSRSAIIGGQQNSISNPLAERSAIITSYLSTISGNSDQSMIIGGNNHSIGVGEAMIIGGNNSYITGGGNNDIIGSRTSYITSGNDVILLNTVNSTNGSYSNVAMLATSGRTATTANATFVENLVVFNYAGLDFANDTAAAAGGVVLGQVYHTAGVLKIRVI